MSQILRKPIMNPMQLVKAIIRRPLNYFGYDLVRMPKNQIQKPMNKPFNLNTRCSWPVHYLYFKEAYDLVSDVDGDVVECGIGKGRSLFMICCLANYENKGRKIHGFDSFEGFPEPSQEDKSPRNPQKGELKTTVDKVFEYLLAETEASGIKTSFIKNNLTLVKGFFEESLHKYTGDQVAFLHLDVDLYDSYKTTLEYFWPKVAKGGIVLFDEYKQNDIVTRFPGAAKAIDEFFGPLVTEIQFNEQAKRYFIVKQ